VCELGPFVLATTNPNKAREIREIFAASGLGVVLVDRPGDVAEVEETEPTLLGNARLKARALVAATGMAAIADDTGIEVEALGGAPGASSARYAGEPPDDQANVDKVLVELAGREGPEQRSARFVTVAVALWPDGREVVAEGMVEGWVAPERRGSGGFGYDCVFVPAEAGGRTFGELAERSPQAKHALSHRGRAFRALAALLAAPRAPGAPAPAMPTGPGAPAPAMPTGPGAPAPAMPSGPGAPAPAMPTGPGAPAPAMPTGPGAPAPAMPTGPGAPAPGARAHRRRWIPRTVRHLAELLLVGFILEYFVVPQIGGTHKAIHVLASINPFLPVAGLLLEAVSLLAYFQLTRSLMPASSDPGLATVSRVELSTLAVSHCVPGGNAVGYSLGYGLFVRAGVGSTDAGLALASQGLGSAVVLNLIFWLALIASLPLYGFHVAYLSAALIGLLLMVAIAALLVLFTKGDKRAKALLTAAGAKLPFLHPETLPKLFTQLTERLHELAKDRRQLAKTIAFASANWLFDAGSLYVFLGAFGRWVDPVALLVAYGLANIAGVIPITPGGLGVIETTLSGILVGFGTPRSIAIWGVIGWRLVNFWLPIPVGGAAYLSLRFHPPADDQAGLAARRALWRARWQWFVELFEHETPTEGIDKGIAVMAPDDDAVGDAPGRRGEEPLVVPPRGHAS